jgi:hypothetical protein
MGSSAMRGSHRAGSGNGGASGGGGGGGGGGGRFSFKVPKAPAAMEKGLVTLRSVKRLLPKLRGPGDGMHGRQMTMLDDDDRGLLG